MPKITKEQGINVSLSTLTSVLALMPILWFIGKPILVSAVSDAMAEEIEDQVKAGVAPLNGAFIAIIQNNIDNLIREIARMEFRRDNPQDGHQRFAEYAYVSAGVDAHPVVHRKAYPRISCQ